MAVGEQPLAHLVRVDVRDLAAEEPDGERRHGAEFEQVRGRTVGGTAAASSRVASRGAGGVPLEIAGGDRALDRKLAAAAARRRRARYSSRRRSARLAARVPTVDGDAVRARRSRRRLHRHLVEVDGGTGAKPSFAAAIERTPEPQPTSSRPVGSTSCRSSRQSRVVACAPVPKARPGSITTAIASAGASSHGGPTQKRPTRTPWWNSRQRVLPALGDVVHLDDVEAERRLVGVDAYAPSSSSTPSGRCGAGARAPARRRRRRTASAERALELVEEALRRARTSRSSACSSNSREQAALLVAEVARHEDVDEDALVAAAEALQDRHAAAAQDDDLAGLRPRPARAPPPPRASGS